MAPEVNAPEVQVGMLGTHCCLKPRSPPGTRWVFENRHESTEAETRTSQFSSFIIGNAYHLVQDLRRPEWKIMELSPFAS